MSPLFRWIVSLALMCCAASASAVELLKFDQPALGLPWNATPEQVQVSYPGTKAVSQRSSIYRGPLSIGSLEYANESATFSFDPDNRLSRVYCNLNDADATQLILLLNEKLGVSRWASYQDARLFQHVYEWSSDAYTLELRYAGVTADALSAPYRFSVQFTVLRDRPRVSQVDAALQLPRLYEQAQQQMLQAQQQEQQRREARAQREAQQKEAERLKALPINSPERPALKKAGSTWGEVFNPGGEIAPLGSFKAYYFNTEAPRTLVGSEAVKDVAISYPWDEFLKIKSENFGGYWVGRVKVAKPEIRTIAVSQSHSKTRVIIDGLVAYEGGTDASFPFEFSAGEHLIEVEFANRWHTTELKVTFARNEPLLAASQIRTELERLGLAAHDVQYVGLYESRSRDLTVALDVQALTKDTVLILSSYSSIKWVASTAQSRVKAVVIGSHGPGSEVTGLSSRIPVLKHSGGIGGYSIETKCSCTAGHFHCENTQSLKTLQDTVGKFSSGSLVGFSGAYGASEIKLPGTALDAAARESDARRQAESEQRRVVCERKLDPDFERMLK